MSYACPRASDFDELRALNVAFLRRLRAYPQGGLDGLQAELALRISRLGDRQLERLAAVPMLLMSFREDDVALWEPGQAREFGDDSGTLVPRDDESQRLLAAGLAFVWQLARRDPYSLRLFTGVTLHWCERVADQPFLSLLGLVNGHANLPVLRAARETSVWQKLLSHGVSPKRIVRDAAHLSSLQMRLTLSGRTEARWASAACRVGAPSLVLRGEPVK